MRTKKEGIIFEEEKLTQIKIGMPKEEIVSLLGTPSFILESTPNAKEEWVYLSIEKQWRAFFAPKIKSQKVLIFEFSGNLASELKILTENDISKTKIALQTNIIQPKKPVTK